MAQVTLGGDRLGSGKEMIQNMHNYGMNSFNQSRDWKSTMAPGLLYPCFKEIGTNFGTFDIDVDSFVRTLPTKGPLFGSFKMQVDIFNVPFRLYQGILHNNPVDIGLNMHKVYLPCVEISTLDGATAARVKGSTADDMQINPSSLEKYLGLSGIGHHANYANQDKVVKRQLQCVPELGYYDIFKNYYSNKQEENAYVIIPGNFSQVIQEFEGGTQNYGNGEYIKTYGKNTRGWNIIYPEVSPGRGGSEDSFPFTAAEYKIKNFEAKHTTIEVYYIDQEETETSVELNFTDNPTYIKAYKKENDTVEILINFTAIKVGYADIATILRADIHLDYIDDEYTSDIILQPFALKNIDKMRALLLANNELENKVIIKNDNGDSTTWGVDSGVDQTGYPYAALVKENEGITWNAFQLNGLVTKTYQSDIFNNWLDNTLVETIATRTKIDTTSGGFTPDTLILQEKIYKLLNRILVSGGTYYDWQEATYGEGVARMCEIPMYIGGMSTEIMFEEVINNSPSDVDGRYQALGSLGGKGMNVNRKGGNNIHVRMDEPGYIMAICSITPRISQSQGNEWDRTELKTMDDLHKPELDGIGFQDLMVEQMCWWNTVLDPNGVNVNPLHRDSVGKQTAWINYQTAIDKVYGDFAKQDGYSFMVLSRQYDHDGVFGVADLTTYIDPSKYNYAFAYSDLASQNFWVQLSFKCTSRRKMGAQQLPTL